ncbi:MAG: hypothetical protein EXX96DRAFT_547530 [Benjaminiella poitrasii]|nr:MAG: hypothetical protein EXX96DRAFT_547530 [Benjaminiella poitrasii]
MIALFVFMALSRGTFNTLSPVMAAQQEEIKRRESIDQSVPSTSSAKDIATDSTNNKASSYIYYKTTKKWPEFNLRYKKKDKQV